MPHLPVLRFNGTQRKTFIPALNTILDKIQANESIRNAWEAGVKTADTSNHSLMPANRRSGPSIVSDPDSTGSCPDCDEKRAKSYFHVCEGCYQSQICVYLRRNRYHLRLCDTCQKEDQTKPILPFLLPTRLLLRLQTCLHKNARACEDTVWTTQDKTSVALSKDIYNEWEKQLQRVNSDGKCEWLDQYTNKYILDTPEPGTKCDWQGRVQSRLLASPDAEQRIVRGNDGKLAYHILHNMRITTTALNMWCNQWPKSLALVAKIARRAKSKADLEYTTNLICNLVRTTRQYPFRLKHRLKRPFTDKELRDLREAERTGQPLRQEWPVRPLYLCSRMPLATVFEIHFEPCRDKFYTGLDTIAALPEFRNIPKEHWLRPDKAGNLVMYLFSPRARLQEDWTDKIMWRWYIQSCHRLTTSCNRHHKDLTKMSFWILMYTHFYLYLGQSTTLADGTWVSRSQDGLEYWPFRGTPCTPSFGHRNHGKKMESGFPDDGFTGKERLYFPEDPTRWDYEKCNIALENWGLNGARGTTDESDIPAILECLDVSETGMENFWDLAGPDKLRSGNINGIAAVGNNEFQEDELAESELVEDELEEDELGEDELEEDNLEEDELEESELEEDELDEDELEEGELEEDELEKDELEKEKDIESGQSLKRFGTQNIM